VLGDEVNVAARLMQAAGPGQVLVSGRVAEATRGAFGFETLAPLAVKGKPKPVPVLALRGGASGSAGQRQAPADTLPLVGRQAELAEIDAALGEALGGAGRVVAVVGEAGVGKSRVVAEAMRRAEGRGFTCYLGEGQSYGTNAVYLAWHAIWRGFFGVDPEATPKAQVEQLAEELARIDPSFGLRLPLLGAALNLTIPENDLTRSLDARQQKDLLEALLVACVRARAQTTPLLLVLEDCHWLDPLSLELAEAIVSAASDRPVLVVLAYRPLDHVDTTRALPLERVTGLARCRVLRLSDFSPAETARLIGLKLRQFGSVTGELPAEAVEQITARAGGNPFHIEEILNYLRDRGVDPRDVGALEQSELPESLHSLILSRIDHLDERQQVVLKVASVVGRQFAVRWLWGVYPDLGEPVAVRSDLDRLSRLDITPLDALEPELRYLFRHILTQQVVYESQPYGTRAALHENLGRFIEATFQDRREQYLDLLAYHYGRSENVEKQRQYYRAAGEHAARRYANAQAVTYFTQALALTPEQDATTRFELVLARMNVFDAQSARAEQLADLDAMADLAEKLDEQRRTEVLMLRADYYSETNDFATAVQIAQEAARRARTIGAGMVEARAYQVWGGAQFRWERYAEAREPLELALATAQATGAQRVEARTFNVLGVLAGDQGDYPGARAMFEQSLRVYRDIGDPWFEATVLSNLGLIASYQWDFAAAKAHLEQAFQLSQATGNVRIQQGAPARLGDIDYYQGDIATARARYEYALPRCRESGDRRYEVHILCRLGLIASALGDHGLALELGESALAVARSRDQLRSQAYALMTLGHAYLGLGRLEEATEAYQQALTLRREIGQHHLVAEPLAGLARGELARGAVAAALAHVEEILVYLQDRTLDGTDERFRIPLTCHQVLTAAGDPRASAVLEEAYRELQTQAGRIEDQAARRSLLENVPWHREIVAAFEARAASWTG
jgi:adenylate cyclase